MTQALRRTKNTMLSFRCSPVKQYEFVRAAKTPISLEFSKEQRVAMLSACLLAVMTRETCVDAMLFTAPVGPYPPTRVLWLMRRAIFYRAKARSEFLGCSSNKAGKAWFSVVLREGVSTRHDNRLAAETRRKSPW